MSRQQTNEPFDQHLRELFAAETVSVADDAFIAGVTRRISRIRNRRRFAVALTAVMLFAVIFAGSASIVTTAGYVAESATALTDALDGLLMTPAAFVFGILTAIYALYQVHFR
jgi:predicted PurR-regulated permease PerM